MIFWAMCFVCSSIFMLSFPHFSSPGQINLTLSAEIRGTGSVGAAMVAILLCINRTNLVRSHEQLAILVKRLPMPFLLSDKNGMLIYVSDEALQLMHISQTEARGKSYFTLLFNLSEKGNTIQSYMRLFDAPEDGVSLVELRLWNCPEKAFVGTLMPVDLQPDRYLITLIKPKQRG